MGMVITNTEEPPSQDSVRCVPKRWVVESTFTPIKVRVLMGFSPFFGVVLTLTGTGFLPWSWRVESLTFVLLSLRDFVEMRDVVRTL